MNVMLCKVTPPGKLLALCWETSLSMQGLHMPMTPGWLKVGCGVRTLLVVLSVFLSVSLTHGKTKKMEAF